MIKVVGVRFKKAGKIYYFDPEKKWINNGDFVIVETIRAVSYTHLGGDRLENEDISFHRSVYEGYKKLSSHFPEIITIDGDRSIDEVFEEIKGLLTI